MKKKHLVFRRMIFDMFRISPGMTTLYCLFDVLHAGGYILVMLCTEKLFDSVPLLAAGSPLSVSLRPLLFLIMATVFFEIANSLSNFHIEHLSPKILSHFYKRIYIKASHISPIDYERPEFLDMLNKALQGVEYGFFASSLILMVFTFYVPYFILLGVYLQHISPILILIVLLIFTPVILGQVIRFRLFSEAEDAIAPIRRATDYYEQVVCNREFFKETRILGIVNHFMQLYQDGVILINQKTLTAEKKHIRIDAALRLFTIGGYIGILLMLVNSLIQKVISPGAFSAVFASVNMMYALAEEMVTMFSGQITQYAVSIQNYHSFIDLPENAKEEGSFDKTKGITLDNVHFSYPNTHTETIRGISLKIQPGETVSIVGENGAGKSTLAKLMLGLYVPDRGTVRIGGLDSEKVASRCIYQNCAAVFQDYQHYLTTLEENITISSNNSCYNKLVKLNHVCERAKLLVNSDSFPQGFSTMLSREFGGVDLSGGQWQRIAIARGIFREHDIIVLDEPTSAIDPIEESLMYQNFKEISEGKTAIIITHRLGAARIADRIIVLKDGIIDDIGTHEELINKGGLYSEMYRTQAQWYE